MASRFYGLPDWPLDIGLKPAKLNHGFKQLADLRSTGDRAGGNRAIHP